MKFLQSPFTRRASDGYEPESVSEARVALFRSTVAEPRNLVDRSADDSRKLIRKLWPLMEPEVPTDSLTSGPTQAETRGLDAFWKNLSEPSVSGRFLRVATKSWHRRDHVFSRRKLDGAQGSEP